MKQTLLLIPILVVCCGACRTAPTRTGVAERALSAAAYEDKLKGAWAAQMIGVCYGLPYEFQSNGKPILEPLQPWSPERIACALDQDDLYVELRFLETLADRGLDVSAEQAGLDFAAAEFPLWHANAAARDNIRNGILPPWSGHPRHNIHADDIDFQIEADLFGLIAPGLPNDVIALCDRFGHIMNYGDGVYGGMFVAGMLSAAFFAADAREALEAGLACIPPESTYARCIRDVIAWHDEYPDDWLETWRRVEERWQDDNDCLPGAAMNIDAKLNGAYVAIGLLYGRGDLARTLEIATRCGQDADCNPASAAGVLGCLYGFEALPAEYTSGLSAMADTPFANTRFSFNTLLPACRQLAAELVTRAGGRIELREGAPWFVIPVRQPVPPALEQWPPEEKRTMIHQARQARRARHQ